MPSIIDGYEYDIFISYRLKDNRGEHWVTEFVSALKTELDSTFKEEISIYFDQNPYDGLLETHLVDQSLKCKLKCLVFIPIISPTYCDTKSFAWTNEFCAFNKLSREDKFGRDIKLENGNVGSRILPVKINELDSDDKSLIESELNGPMRSIEFIYKEPGVHRPLKSDDNENKNLNGTKYRNQLNKVANATKDIISALRRGNSMVAQITKDIPTPKSQSKASGRSAIVISAVVILALSVAAYLILFNQRPAVIEPSDKSIAVLPFSDLSESKDQEWFSDGLTEELLNSMAHLEELRVIARTSSFAFKGKNIPIQKIADSLHVAYIVEGSVRKHADQLRITAQLIRANDGIHVWSQTYDRPAKDIFAIQEDIAQNITTALDIFLDDSKREQMFFTGTRNVEAYEAYLQGNALYLKAHENAIYKLKGANKYFDKAISLDPGFAAPYYGHHDLYAHYVMNRNMVSDSLSVERALELVHEDLNNAIQNAHDEGERLHYEIDDAYLSKNWSKLPMLLNRLESSEENMESFARRESGWAFMILMGIDRDELARKVIRKYREVDPLDYRTAFFEIPFLISQNKLDSAFVAFKKLESYNSTNSRLYWLKSYLTAQLGDRTGAYEMVKSKLSSDDPIVLTTRIWIGEKDEVKKIIGRISPSRSQLVPFMYLHTMVGDREKANKLAHDLDAEPLGPQYIIDRMFSYSGKLPFDLAATPNLSARLREAGIDPEEYQKRNFINLPSSNQ